jgi:hypothetical protein
MVDVFERPPRAAGAPGIPTLFERFCRPPERGVLCVVDTADDFLENWANFHDHFGEVDLMSFCV